MNKGKFIGSTMILVGTTIGAGMLGLPLVSPLSGALWAPLLMIAFWATSTLTALMVVETNLALPKHSCSLSSMAEQTIGPLGKIIVWISTLFLLYSVITAYIIGETDLLISLTKSSKLKIDVSAWIISVVFTFALGIAVFWSTKAVDYFNRSFLSVKGFLLFATLVLITPHIDVVNLVKTSQSLSQVKYLCLAVPVFVFAFGYHFVIPSIRLYIGDDPKQLQKIILTGGIIALAIYLWWLIAVLGMVPLKGESSFMNLVEKPKDLLLPGKLSVGKLTQTMISIVNNKWVTSLINSFTNIAMTTSFLGVSLSLFDFLADGFNMKNDRFGRFKTAILTFTPPLAFALFYPKGFVIAISYAAAPLALLALNLPALMVYKMRKSKTLKSPYRAKFTGNISLCLVSLIGLVSITLAIMYNLGLLVNL